MPLFQNNQFLAPNIETGQLPSTAETTIGRHACADTKDPNTSGISERLLNHKPLCHKFDFGQITKSEGTFLGLKNTNLGQNNR